MTSSDIGSGAVYVFKGTYTGLVPWRKLVAPYGYRNSRDGFGSALAAGDLNGDGRAELVVGAPQALVGGVRSGAAWLFEGTKSRPRGAYVGHRPVRLRRRARFHRRATRRRARRRQPRRLGRRRNRRRRARPRGRLPLPQRRQALHQTLPRGRRANSHFGGALATGRLGSSGGGAINASAPSDLLIGAPGGTRQHARGRALRLARRRARGRADSRRVGRHVRADGDGFGAAVVTGRFSTAGTTQVAVGAPGHSNRRGRVYVLSITFNARGGGATAKLHQTLLRSDLGALAEAADTQFGRSLAVVPSAPAPFITPADGLAVGMPGTLPPGKVGLGTVGFFVGSRDTTPTLKGMAATLSQPAYRGDTGGYQSFGLALAAGDFNHQPGAELAIAVPGKTDNIGAVWVALSGTPPNFGTEFAAPNFAVFLDQEYVYNHWPAP